MYLCVCSCVGGKGGTVGNMTVYCIFFVVRQRLPTYCAWCCGKDLNSSCDVILTFFVTYYGSESDGNGDNVFLGMAIDLHGGTGEGATEIMRYMRRSVAR